MNGRIDGFSQGYPTKELGFELRFSDSQLRTSSLHPLYPCRREETVDRVYCNCGVGMRVMSVEAQVSSGCWGPQGGNQGWGAELSQGSSVQVIFIHQLHNCLLNIYLCLELT